jgi:hypothetical protein
VHVKMWALVVATVLTLGVLAGPTHAQDSLLNADLSTTADFPNGLTFHLRGDAPVVIDHAEVRYQVDQLSCGTSTAIGLATFAPTDSLSLDWEWDLRDAGGLPVGAKVTYQWVVSGQGRTFETPFESVIYEDPRYDWRSVTSDHTTIQWYTGSDSFARDLLQAADAGISQLERSTGVVPSETVVVRVYATTEAMRETVLFSPEWAGGIAFPAHNLVAMGISVGNLSWGRDAMVHEMTHVVIGQATFRCGSSLPAWLDEGLAVYNEGDVASDFRVALENAVAENRAFTVRGLAGAFPSSQDGAILAYAQSRSLVAHLIETYGAVRMNELLTAFQQLGTIDRALRDVYGFDSDGLESEWRTVAGLPDREVSTGVERELLPTIPSFGLPLSSTEITPTPSPTPPPRALPVVLPTSEPTAIPAPGGGTGCNRSDSSAGLDGGIVLGLLFGGIALRRRVR